jgi:hypothetical protein
VYGHTVEIMGQVAMDLARTSRKSGGTAVTRKGLGLQTSENLTGVRFNHVFKDRLLLGPVLVPGPPWVLGQGSWDHRGSWDKGPRTAMGPGSNMVLGPVEFQPDWVKPFSVA